MQDIFDEDGDPLIPYYVIPYKIEKQERGDWTYEVALGEGEIVATSREDLFDKAKAVIAGNIATWGELKRDSYGSKSNAYMVKTYDLPALEKLDYVFMSWDDLKTFAAKKPGLGYSYLVFDDMRIELRIASQLRPSFTLTDTERFALVSTVINAKLMAVESLKKKLQQLEAADEEIRIARKRAELAALKAELGED